MKPGSQVDELARAVIGSAIEVHRELGPGYSEAVYEEALAREFFRAGIGFERQKSFKVRFRGAVVGEGRIDFLVERQLVVEIKAVEKLAPIHKSQVISYRKAAACRLGLLINFNEHLLKAGCKGSCLPFLIQLSLRGRRFNMSAIGFIIDSLGALGVLAAD